jgi:nucleoid-associated protein YgaU
MATAPVPPNSRYAGIEVAFRTEPDGRLVAYLRRRFLPPPERLALLTQHVVVQGDRLDRIAATYLGDPEQFWRVADANRAMRPDELTEEPGRRLRITQPDGLPGLPSPGGLQ